jgi:Tfp pilus assembly protein PilZ
VDVAVTEDSDHNFYVGLDGVIHGIFIATYRPAKLGERVAVTIHLPESLVPVTSFGEVRWLRECDSDSHTPPGIGVHINHLDREEVDAVEEYVSTRAPLLYDE